MIIKQSCKRFYGQMKSGIKVNAAGSSGIQKASSYWDNLANPSSSPLPKATTTSSILTRGFIHNSLYHPEYGYFSKKAHIFSLPEKVPYKELRDSIAFQEFTAEFYRQIDDVTDVDDVARQVWHTPTELFKPYYGYSIADYLFKMHDKAPPGQDLVVYEVGAGNGTLMLNILDYALEKRPDIYKKIKYNVIEISQKLATRQAQRFDIRNVARKHAHAVSIINKSIFDWTTPVAEPCFFIAMEVIDNFAHDLIRYQYNSNVPLQAKVALDAFGDYIEEYEQVTDKQILEYLALRDKVGYQSPLVKNLWKRQIISALSPISPNLTIPEFLPSQAMKFFQVLFDYFPNHQLCLSDFYCLPETIEGIDAPVVQTRYQGSMIPCSTYLVQPGWFDIFFPTNFELMEKIYLEIGRQRKKKRSSSVVTQQEFLKSFSTQLQHTETRSGENPMLTFYENFKFLLSEKA